MNVMLKGVKVKRTKGKPKKAGGHSLGLTDLRLVVGSRTPHGPLEVLDYSVADSWQAIADRLRQRFPTSPKVLISDGEEGIPDALAGPATLPQRCLVHARRGLPFALYQDRAKKAVPSATPRSRRRSGVRRSPP